MDTAGDPVPLNVWWLDAHHEFRKAKHPDDLSNKLAWLYVNAEAQGTRGIHICELCPRMEYGMYRGLDCADQMPNGTLLWKGWQ
jgi:hypothetical protein